MKPLASLLLLACPWISSFQDPATAPDVAHRTRVFDVRPLLRELDHHRAPELGATRDPIRSGLGRLQPGPAPPTPPRPARASEEALRETAEVLAELARAFLRPPSEAASLQPSLVGPDELHLTGNAAQIAWLERFLELQHPPGPELEMKTTFLRVPVEGLQGLAHGRVLAAKELRRLMERLDRLRGAELLGSQTVNVQPLQRIAFSLTREVDLVREGRPSEVVTEGTALEVAAARLDERHLGLRVDSQHVHLVEPAGGAPMDARHLRDLATFSLLPGESAVVVLRPERERALVAILTLELVAR